MLSREDAERYIKIIEWQDQINTYSVCKVCGSTVFNAEVHIEWHKNMENDSTTEAGEEAKEQIVHGTGPNNHPVCSYVDGAPVESKGLTMSYLIPKINCAHCLSIMLKPKDCICRGVGMNLPTAEHQVGCPHWKKQIYGKGCTCPVDTFVLNRNHLPNCPWSGRV